MFQTLTAVQFGVRNLSRIVSLVPDLHSIFVGLPACLKVFHDRMDDNDTL